MDKKTLAIVIFLGVVLIGIITAVFLYDGMLNTNILEVNGTKYSKDDFESYLKVWQYENGETPVDLNTMYENYIAYKLYSQYVDKYHVELPSGEQVTAPSETDVAKLSGDYNLSESEYMRVKTEIATVDYLFANLQDYWKVSDAEYEEHKVGNENLFKMYDYRVMQVAVEQPAEESGDVSGDVSGDATTVSGDVSEEDDEQARKDAAKSRAVEALAKVQSGDSFEEVAKEYGTMRIVVSNGGYSIVNGNKESVSGLYMNESGLESNVINALQTLNKGEYSEIFEGDSNYTFVYLEDIREGLDEYDDNTYKRQIANEHIQNEARIIRESFTLKSIDLEELIPALTKVTDESGDVVTDEHDHEHDHEEENTNLSGDNTASEISGDVSPVESGEIAE